MVRYSIVAPKLTASYNVDTVTPYDFKVVERSEIDTQIRPQHEPTTTIKPSEAVKLGRLKYPRHIKFTTFGVDGQSACFMGAMLAGYGMDNPIEYFFNQSMSTFFATKGLTLDHLRFMAQRFDSADDTYLEEREMVYELEAVGL